jgi:hypothetical protein
MAKKHPKFVFCVSGPVIDVTDLREVFEASDDQLLRMEFELPAHLMRDVLLAIKSDIFGKGER